MPKHHAPDRLKLLALVLLATAAACGTPETTPPADAGTTDAGAQDAGGTDAGAPDAGETDAGAPDAGEDIVPIAPEAMHTEILRATCRAFARCGVGNIAYADEAGCLVTVEARAVAAVAFNGLPQLKAAIASGDVTVDGRAARGCLEAIATTSPCAVVLASDHLAFALEPACRGVFSGRLAKDAACVLDEACAGDSHCARDDRGACAGTCLPRGEGACEGDDACLAGQRCGSLNHGIGRCQTSVEGASCRVHADCGAGFECHEGRRSGLTCRPAPGAGESCTGTCAQGFYCPLSEPAPKCLPLPEAGGSCLAPQRCAAGLACRTTLPPGTCRVLPAAGEPCSPEGECRTDAACDWSTSTPTCLSQFAALGEECVDRSCGTGLGCDGATQRCVALPTLGQACSPQNLCVPGLRCAVQDGVPTCLAAGEEGDSCRAHEQCADGLFCPEGTCAPRLAEDDNCSPGSTRECAAGLSCVAASGRYACRSLPGAGEACPQTQCATDHWCVPPTVTPEMVTCAPAPGAGERCVGGTCAPGLHCRYEEGQTFCRAPGKEGDACTRNVDWPCAPGLECLAPDGVGLCLPMRRPGEACTHSIQCGDETSSYLCLDGTCAPRPKAGAPCAKFTYGQKAFAVCDSFSAWCDESKEVPTCAAFLAPGAACDGNHDACGVRAGRGYCSETCVSREPAECGESDD